MNERLKQIRASLGLNTRNFAERLGMSAGAISLLETGKRNMTSQFITSVCREYRVNEIWLRTGEGEMFEEDLAQEVADMADRLLDMDEGMKKAFVSTIMEMDEAELGQWYTAGKKMLEGIEKNLPQK